MNKKRRRLGQHLLIDTKVLNAIVDNAEIGKEIVYEIGTGNGILTVELCRRAGRVISCEVDRGMIAAAEDLLGKYSNLTLLEGNGLMFDGNFDVFVSNLPYSKSRKTIEWLATRRFDRAIIMVQKEFAQKILSTNGHNYRAVSALAQHCFDIEIVKHVSKECFNPQPKVDSVLLKLIQKDIVGSSVVRALNILFSYRGKKATSVAKKFKIRNISTEKRIEQLTPSEAVGMARMIEQKQRLLQTL
ncbi:MAG: ribosomal RNA small subunit methyltransferase A [Nitrososphaerales archaeon]